MRDIAILTLMLVLLWLAARSSFNAYVLWAWSGLMAIESYTYTAAGDLRFGMLFAMMTLVQLLLRSRGASYRLGSGVLPLIMFLIILHGLAAATFAFPGLGRNWEIYKNVATVGVFCLCLPLIVTTPLRLHALILILCLGAGSHAIIEGARFIASGGSHIVRGVPRLGDNNHVALVTVMMIPFLLYLARYTVHRYLRYLLLGAALISGVAVFATYSRGGLIALVVFALWKLAISKHRIRALLIVIGLVAVVLPFTPEQWTSRMNTIAEADDDSSFMGRVAAWKASSAVAVARPVFGGGFYAIQDGEVWKTFNQSDGILGFVDTPVLAGIGGGGIAAHSIYFQILGDQGFFGLFWYGLFFLVSFAYAVQIARRASVGGPSEAWKKDYANACWGSLFIYLVGGAALSLAYFEVPYILGMTLLVVRNLPRRPATAL